MFVSQDLLANIRGGGVIDRSCSSTKDDGSFHVPLLRQTRWGSDLTKFEFQLDVSTYIKKLRILVQPDGIYHDGKSINIEKMDLN